jgi:hypothetical protein
LAAAGLPRAAPQGFFAAHGLARAGTAIEMPIAMAIGTTVEANSLDVNFILSSLPAGAAKLCARFIASLRRKGSWRHMDSSSPRMDS